MLAFVAVQVRADGDTAKFLVVLQEPGKASVPKYMRVDGETATVLSCEHAYTIEFDLTLDLIEIGDGGTGDSAGVISIFENAPLLITAPYFPEPFDTPLYYSLAKHEIVRTIDSRFTINVAGWALYVNPPSSGAAIREPIYRFRLGEESDSK